MVFLSMEKRGKMDFNTLRKSRKITPIILCGCIFVREIKNLSKPKN